MSLGNDVNNPDDTFKLFMNISVLPSLCITNPYVYKYKLGEFVSAPTCVPPGVSYLNVKNEFW